MTLADLIMDDKTAEETKKAVRGCIRATMLSALDTFKELLLEEADPLAMAKALAVVEELCVEQTMLRIHCRVIGKPSVSPSSN